MYKGPANRLLREGEWTIRQLVEELYAIFQTEEVKSTGQLVMDQRNATDPSIIINQPSYSEVPPFTIIKRGKNGEEIGRISISAGGIEQDGEPYAPTATNIGEITGDNAITPVELLGQVVSGGPGESYLVNIWGKDPQISGGVAGVAASKQITAKQAQIDPTDTIPPGTWCKVIGYPALELDEDDTRPVTWYLLVPVWL